MPASCVGNPPGVTLSHSVSYAGHSPGEPRFPLPVWISELSEALVSGAVQIYHNRETLFPFATLKKSEHH